MSTIKINSGSGSRVTVNKPGSPSSASVNRQPEAPPQFNVGKANVITVGDSLTAGVGAGGKISALLDTELFITPTINRGISGNRTDQTLSVLDFYCKRDYNPATSRNIAWVMMGTNDIVQSKTVVSITDNLISICDLLRSHGIKVIIAVPPEPYRNANGTSSYPNYHVLRTWIQDNWQSELNASALVDVYLDEIVGSYTPAYAEYWNADRLHFTSIGYERIASLFVPSLNEVEAEISVIPDALTIPVTDDINNTFSATIPSGYSATDLDYTLDEGESFDPVVSMPLVIGDIPKLTNSVGLRVKAIGNNPPSAWLWNDVAFTGTPPDSEFIPYTDQRWTYGAGWNFTQPHYCFTSNIGINFSARLHFTHGIKFQYFGQAGTYVFVVDGVIMDTVSGSGKAVGDIMYEHHPNTETDKLFQVYSSTGFNIASNGATVYNTAV